MIYDDYEVEIRHEIARFGRTIWIYRRTQDHRVAILQPDGEEKFYGPTDAVEPSFYIDENVFKKLAKVIYDNSPKPDENFMKGKMDQMEDRIKDLRWLLKMPKDI